MTAHVITQLILVVFPDFMVEIARIASFLHLFTAACGGNGAVWREQRVCLHRTLSSLQVEAEDI